MEYWECHLCGAVEDEYRPAKCFQCSRGDMIYQSPTTRGTAKVIAQECGRPVFNTKKCSKIIDRIEVENLERGYKQGWQEALMYARTKIKNAAALQVIDDFMKYHKLAS